MARAPLLLARQACSLALRVAAFDRPRIPWQVEPEEKQKVKQNTALLKQARSGKTDEAAGAPSADAGKLKKGDKVIEKGRRGSKEKA